MRDLEGKMCELIEEPGLKAVYRGMPVLGSGSGGGGGGEVLGVCNRGLVQIKEVSAMIAS